MNQDPFWTAEDTDSPPLAPVVMAAFDGDCEGCNQGIVEGDDIRSDGAGGWVHADCAEGVA